jgi:nickel-dependent lactate racemase
LVELWIPYGDVEVSVKVQEENLAWSVDPRQAGAKDSLGIVRTAISSPLGSPKLSDLVKPGARLGLLVGGLPSRLPMTGVLQLILEEASMAGISPGDVKVIIATGPYAPDKAVIDELRSQLKDSMLTVNDPRAGDFVDIGVTSFGTKVQLNRSFVEADLKAIVSGFSIDWLRGYTGGPSCIVPGIASHNTIVQNGKLALQKDADLGPGKLQANSVHLDSKEAASSMDIDFSIALLPDGTGGIRSAFAGDFDEVFRRSIGAAGELYLHKVSEKADLLIVGAGGRPFDATLFDACNALFNVEGIVDRDGRLVIVAECRDGPGGGAFLNLLSHFKDRRTALAEVRKDFSMGGYKALRLIELKEGHGISLVSAMPGYFSKIFALRTADTANEGLQNAFRFLGRESRIGVVIDGSCTAPSAVDGAVQALNIQA